MTDRIIDVSDEPARLHMRNELLVIEREGKDDFTVPLVEVAAVALSNPSATISHGALSGLSKAGAMLVVCDEKRLPCGMMIPIADNTTQSERFAWQAAASLPTKKRVWQQIITAKILAQGKLLKEVGGSDHGLIPMSKNVKSGDSENLEAQAARIYWKRLFRDESFVRERKAEDQNRLLNYGYAILRALVARAICSSGLHPSLGVHHHSRYDAFCLADDLMEPFRPIVDRAVIGVVADRGPLAPLDKETKGALIGAITGKFDLDEEERSLFEILSRTSASLVRIFEGKGEELKLPEL